eukprot:CAMPEP_0168432122 /NCGR_PEP_ID=MMETSP0228-20121227/38731_1 /TAXON_ID=133427 /ORGANISM="Protoceratium reticulatum, Strain CCCM 535 (=CCMP 1889)" /LENGTH=171 /DNA_ID=CAMNT_0008446245 /DNA_START=81 /DNA_END=592 /DNA_ORIENTATION=-
MEVRVEDVDNALPEGSYISVRFGDVQKQTQYDAKKLYRFPEARRFGKVDVYRRMGTCDVHWNLDQPESRTCTVLGSAGDGKVRLKVSMTRPASGLLPGAQEAQDLTMPTAARGPGNAFAPDARASKSREASVQAKRYLMENDVEGILTSAMRALLKAMPEDAPKFLCDFIG